MGAVFWVIFLVSIIVAAFVVFPLLILSAIHVGRGMWVCPRCGHKSIKLICRKCGLDRRSVPRSEIRFIGEWGAGSTAFVLVLWGTLGSVVSAFISGILVELGVEKEIASIVGDLQLYVFVFIVTAYIISFRYGKGLREIGLGSGNMGLSLGIGVGIAVIALVVDSIYTDLLLRTPLAKFIREAQQQVETLKSLGFSNPTLWLFVITTVVIGPVVEELVFRALTHRGFKRRWGSRKAMIFGSLLFAVLHPWPSFIPILIFGFLLVWFYDRTNNLTGCIIAHSLNNLGVILMAMLG
jgi:hypothetical protein